MSDARNLLSPNQLIALIEQTRDEFVGLGPYDSFVRDFNEKNPLSLEFQKKYAVAEQQLALKRMDLHEFRWLLVERRREEQADNEYDNQVAQARASRQERARENMEREEQEARNRERALHDLLGMPRIQVPEAMATIISQVFQQLLQLHDFARRIHSASLEADTLSTSMHAAHAAFVSKWGLPAMLPTATAPTATAPTATAPTATAPTATAPTATAPTATAPTATAPVVVFPLALSMDDHPVVSHVNGFASHESHKQFIYEQAPHLQDNHEFQRDAEEYVQSMRFMGGRHFQARQVQKSLMPLCNQAFAQLMSLVNSSEHRHDPQIQLLVDRLRTAMKRAGLSANQADEKESMHGQAHHIDFPPGYGYGRFTPH